MKRRMKARVSRPWRRSTLSSESRNVARIHRNDVATRDVTKSGASGRDGRASAGRIELETSFSRRKGERRRGPDDRPMWSAHSAQQFEAERNTHRKC